MISFVKFVALPAAFAFAALMCGTLQEAYANDDQSGLSVRVGLVHSLSGTMAVVEKGLVAAELLAIDQINSEGGVSVNGREYFIEAIIKDGGSRWPLYAHQAKQLIDRDRVPVVFGGWTSASRKAM